MAEPSERKDSLEHNRLTELDDYERAIYEEVHEERNREFIKILLEDGYTLEEIASRLKLTVEQVKAWAP